MGAGKKKRDQLSAGRRKLQEYREMKAAKSGSNSESVSIASHSRGNSVSSMNTPFDEESEERTHARASRSPSPVFGDEGNAAVRINASMDEATLAFPEHGKTSGVLHEHRKFSPQREGESVEMEKEEGAHDHREPAGLGLAAGQSEDVQALRLELWEAHVHVGGLQDELASLRADKELLRADKEALQAEVAKSRKDAKDSEGRLQALLKEQIGRVSKLKQEASSTLAERERALTHDFNQQLSGVRTELAATKKERAALQASLEQAQKELGQVRRALDVATAERGALSAARDDLSKQLRLATERLREAEEEQCKAEEDTARMRSELERLSEAVLASEDVAAGGSSKGGNRSGRSSPGRDAGVTIAVAFDAQEREMLVADLKMAMADLEVERKKRGALEASVARMEERLRQAGEQQGQVAAAKSAVEALLEQAHRELQATQVKLRDAQAVAQARGAEAKSAQSRDVLQGKSAKEEATPPTKALADSLTQTDGAGATDSGGEGVGKSPHKEDDSIFHKADPHLREHLQSLRSRCIALERERASLQEAASALEDRNHKLDVGHKKLLAEVDALSLEIERLFSENCGLTAGLQETSEIAHRWEQQVSSLMAVNTELRTNIAELKNALAARAVEPGSALSVPATSALSVAADGGERAGEGVVGSSPVELSSATPGHELEAQDGTLPALQRASSRTLWLQRDVEAGDAAGDAAQDEGARPLASQGLPKGDEQSYKDKYETAKERADVLAAKFAELSANYTLALQTISGIHRSYAPVLSGIEKRLMTIQNDPLSRPN